MSALAVLHPLLVCVLYTVFCLSPALCLSLSSISLWEFEYACKSLIKTYIKGKWKEEEEEEEKQEGMGMKSRWKFLGVRGDGKNYALSSLYTCKPVYESTRSALRKRVATFFDIAYLSLYLISPTVFMSRKNAKLLIYKRSAVKYF